jgi:hypothetical protein
MVRLFCFIVVIIGFTTVFAQDEQYIRSGTLKASATIAPSVMLNRSVQNIYINGFIAYQLDRKLSLRGDTYYFMKNAAAKATDIGYSGGMHTYFGAFYHETKGNWDNYIGFQPGISVVQTIYNSGASVSPSFAVKLGTAFYVWKYFHFFADVTYTNTSVRGISNGAYRADELILSAGLGFQINSKPALRTISTPEF